MVEKITILIPEHSRILRLKQVVRNIRETARYHHEIIVVGDRLDMCVMYDYDPKLVDLEFAEYIKSNKLTIFPFNTGNFTIDDCARVENLFTMKKWIGQNRDYLEKYDVKVKECPLDYKIREKYAVRHSCLPRNKTLRDLKEWDFGADVVVNWIMEEGDFEHNYVMVTDDDMFFLKDWDHELLKHVDEEAEEEFVYTPKVYNVKRAGQNEEPGLECTLGAFELRVPSNSVYLDTSHVAKVASEINSGRPEVTVEACGARKYGSMLPMLLRRRLWRVVGGRDYLISDEKDGTAPGRFIGGTEVHFDDKLGEYGILKKLCWRSICVHTKHPLKFQ